MLFRRKRQQIYLYYIIFPEEKKDVFMIRWKKIFAALPLLLTACASPTEQAQTETVWAMDTACTITLHGGGVSETASLLRTLDKMLDNYSTDSAVSRLNQSGTLSGEEDVSRLVQETACDWIKLDFNVDPGLGCKRDDHGHQEGLGMFFHVKNYYRVLDRLREIL